MFTQAFERAVAHAMIYEVGAFFNPNDPETQAGLIKTAAQRRKVGYVNDPLDAGGETKFGVAKNANPVNIRTLTWEEAKAIYFNKYWMAGGCHLLNDRLAMLHFDGCVNHGVGRASKFLQEAAGVTQDGQVGPKTAAKANSMNEKELINTISDRRKEFYNAIVAAKPSQARYINGWMRRINEVTDFVLK